MIIFLVYSGNYDDRHPVAAFSTEEKATAYARVFVGTERRYVGTPEGGNDIFKTVEIEPDIEKIEFDPPIETQR